MHCVRNYSFILILIGIFFITCSKEKYEATIPSYITINNITLTTNYNEEGSASSNITDAWVFINDDLVGVYELPATFPILKEGDVELKVYAGIKDNGIAATRARYLLYDPHIEHINLVKEQTLVINPQVTYNSDVKFTWKEDFENASLSFLYHVNSDTTIFKQNGTVKEGSYSGKIILESSMNFFEATSVSYSNIPKNGTPVYFELDFKTNEPIVVGIYHDGDQYAKITLNVAENWKKIYINLTDLVNAPVNANDIKVFFGFQETANDPFLTDNPEVYIDNLKLVHY